MKIIEGKEANYAAWRGKNSDGYGTACFMFAERWAELMEVEISKGKEVAAVAKACCREADKEFGITGFMYGMAVSILSQCWAHGEALRLWHNLDVQLGDEGEKANRDGGVLNPALLTFERPKDKS